MHYAGPAVLYEYSYECTLQRVGGQAAKSLCRQRQQTSRHGVFLIAVWMQWVGEARRSLLARRRWEATRGRLGMTLLVVRERVGELRARAKEDKGQRRAPTQAQEGAGLGKAGARVQRTSIVAGGDANRPREKTRKPREESGGSWFRFLAMWR